MKGEVSSGRTVLVKTVGRIAALVVAVALVATPASALAAKGGQGKSKGKTKSCAKATTRGFQVTGTLVSLTKDDPLTDESEASVTLVVTAANHHARNSGELDDQDPDRNGMQVVGATYTVPAGDAFVLKLGDYGTGEPAEEDRVKVKGRIGFTKKRCAGEGTTTDELYATPDVTRVAVSPREPDTTPETE
jgi:hypothetical protein